MEQVSSTPIKLISFNCKNVIRSADCVRRLCRTSDIIALQETWLLPHDVPFLGTIDDGFAFTGTSAVDTTAGVLRGRPYGGVALLWRKSAFPCVTVIPCDNVRIAAIKVVLSDRSIMVISVYMPTASVDNLIEFTNCLSDVNTLIENGAVESVFVLGDFNAHPGELFSNELINFCTEQSWSCVDLDLLPIDTYTFVSEAHGCLRWLDHCVTTGAARRSVRNVSVLHDAYWSDHCPLLVECDLKLIRPKIIVTDNECDKVIWGERNSEQTGKFFESCHSQLRNINFPVEFTHCADHCCYNEDHKRILKQMYCDIVQILRKAAADSYVGPVSRKHKYMPGWNKHVSGAHREARLCYQNWFLGGKQKSGPIYDSMCQTRRIFKSRVKFCQDNEKQIKLDIIAQHHSNKQFGKFWKKTNKLNPKSSLPVSVAGVHVPCDIANLFQRHFRVESPPVNSIDLIRGTEVREGDIAVRFSAQEVSSVIHKMVRGKSPGHDSLSIEHLKYAGVHLFRVLAMFFSLCVSHCYLPDELTHTVVVPVLKNKTGDVSELANYRPISLATVIAKVLDSLLDKHLDRHIELHDAQFGFRPGLSTESAILCLKQTVQYYTTRNTPVYACYLDLSRAFDLVSYDVLWQKMKNKTNVSRDVIAMLRYWYSSQRNVVRWAGSYSDEYQLECGVRQGGLTSPRLFNLYMNELIGELSRTSIGCHIDGQCVNNISYADDMVLLSPSISAMRRLLNICEKYARTHGLRYNVKKSEVMVFKAGSKSFAYVPPLYLCGASLNRVSNFKYLGHWVSEDLCDNTDLERERRALSVRCNMLARRFARCTEQVKVTLFKAFCQSFYTCSLWTKYTQRTYSALRVQYNNAFRVLFGLPRHCSASAMFAVKSVDGFHAIIRKRSASLMKRMRASSNSLLSVFVGRWDSPMWQHWMRLHTAGGRVQGLA